MKKRNVTTVAMTKPGFFYPYYIPVAQVYAKLNDGWNIVEKAQQDYYQTRIERINASIVVHSY